MRDGRDARSCVRAAESHVARLRAVRCATARHTTQSIIVVVVIVVVVIVVVVVDIVGVVVASSAIGAVAPSVAGTARPWRITRQPNASSSAASRLVVGDDESVVAVLVVMVAVVDAAVIAGVVDVFVVAVVAAVASVGATPPSNAAVGRALLTSTLSCHCACRAAHARMRHAPRAARPPTRQLQ